MSPDTIGILVSLAGFALTVMGGVWGLLHFYVKKIDARFDKVDGELHEIRRDIGNVKERIARLEGPERQLQFR